MTTTNYYYQKDANGKQLVIDEPGELCDFCGKLDTIDKKGSLIKVTIASPIMEEFGHSSDDLHAHRGCLELAIREYEEMLKQWSECLDT